MNPMNPCSDGPCVQRVSACRAAAHQPPDDAETAPASSPDGTTAPPSDDRSDAVERQAPSQEDESADPVGDGHSDADLAERLPATPD